MSYSLQTASWALQPATAAGLAPTCDCQQAQKFCAPSFVFSISGQVGFRYALVHVISCSQKVCAALKDKTISGMKEKLTWLFEENVILGCVLVQPFIYGEKRMIFSKTRFETVADHLARCPRASCAQLRRAVLLTIRSRVSPAANRQLEVVEESDEE